MTIKKIKENNFDRGRLYYPLVMNYIQSIHGFTDLVSRGLIRKINQLREGMSENEINNFVEALNIRNEGDKNEFKIILKPAPLIGELQFTTTHKKNIKIDIDEISDELFKEGLYLVNSLNNAACMLLISAFEISKDWDDQNDPIWNFLYHCRNASAHKNRFRIKTPRFPAVWRGLEITKELNGSALFKRKKEEKYFLEFGDPITLLWDIEQKYKSMKISENI